MRPGFKVREQKHSQQTFLQVSKSQSARSAERLLSERFIVMSLYTHVYHGIRLLPALHQCVNSILVLQLSKMEEIQLLRLRLG